MQLDHFVIHTDADYRLTHRLASECAPLGLVFDPVGNRNFDSFSAHYLYVGLEYLEIVQLKKPDESGWVPQWIERYNRGVRGIYCLFVASNDIEFLAKELRAQGFDVNAERSSFFDASGTEHALPWRQIFMAPIPGTDVEISFIQYDSPRVALREIFEPNSDENGFTGIQRVELSFPGLDKAQEFLGRIFPHLESAAFGLRVSLENGEIHFRQSDSVSLRLTARGTNRRLHTGGIRIANVTLETEIK